MSFLIFIARSSVRFGHTAFLCAVLLLTSTVSAQDALGGGAAFDDEWDAILKLAPPSVAASEAPQKKGGRSRESDEPKERSRGKEREPASSEQKGEGAAASERSSSDKPAREKQRADERDESEPVRAATRDRNEGESSRRGRDSDKEDPKTRNREPVSARAPEGALRLSARAPEGALRLSARAPEGALRLSARAPEGALRQKDEPKRRGATADRQEEPRGSRGSEKSEQVELTGGQVEGYEGLVRAWHEPWPAHAGDQAVDLIAGAPPVLSMHPVGKAAIPYVLLPNGKDGGFNEAQLAVASQAFGGWPGGPQVSARLLDLIYHAAQHFQVFHVHLVSGVRNDRSGSRHSHGLAADIVLPGVSDEELAAYFRPQGFLGVGIYTRAGFVHVDVRERSYFWLDKSPPGRRTKIIQVRAEEARLADEAALLRGQVGYVNPPRLQKALHARAKRRMEKAAASQ
jgi:hypothetical protein